MTPTDAIVQATTSTEALPWQAQIALATLSTIAIVAGAWQATKASRHSRRAAEAATDVANRTITNHGRNLGQHVEQLGEVLADLSQRVDDGHRVMEQAVEQLVNLRETVDEHVNTPHSKPRTRKKAEPEQTGPVDLEGVAQNLTRKRTPRKRSAS